VEPRREQHDGYCACSCAADGCDPRGGFPGIGENEVSSCIFHQHGALLNHYSHVHEDVPLGASVAYDVIGTARRANDPHAGPTDGEGACMIRIIVMDPAGKRTGPGSPAVCSLQAGTHAHGRHWTGAGYCPHALRGISCATERLDCQGMTFIIYRIPLSLPNVTMPSSMEGDRMTIGPMQVGNVHFIGLLNALLQPAQCSATMTRSPTAKARPFAARSAVLGLP
jgi:hypothetical protein